VAHGTTNPAKRLITISTNPTKMIYRRGQTIVLKTFARLIFDLGLLMVNVDWSDKGNAYALMTDQFVF
jgi:hypothetical protein